jgi:chromosomal replication initiation ATPase DnaA
MDTFTAALEVLITNGYSNALELANQIELTAMRKPRPRNFESEKARLFAIMKQRYPNYCAGKKPVYNDIGETVSYIEDRRELSMEAIDSKSRIRELVEVRQIMMHILRVYGDYSFKEIGIAFGGRDHSTAIHSKDTVYDLCDTDKAYKAKFEEIKKAYLS